MTPETGAVDTKESKIRIVALFMALVSFFLFFLLMPLGLRNVSSQIDQRSLLGFWIFWLVFPFLFLASSLIVYVSQNRLIEKNLRIAPLRNKHENVEEMVNDCAKELGLKNPPKTYLIDTEEVQCFVYGRTGKGARLAISSGMVQLLERNQLRATLLHELSHIRNGDMGVVSWGIFMVKLLKYWFVALVFYEFLLFLSIGKPDLTLDSLALFDFPFLVLFPTLIFNSLLRVRESLADARASLFLQTKQDLIFALKRSLEVAILKHGLFGELNSKKSLLHKIKTHLALIRLPQSIYEHTFLSHPLISNRIRDLNQSRFLSRKDKPLLPTFEASFIAGLVSFYGAMGVVLNFFSITLLIIKVPQDPSEYSPALIILGLIVGVALIVALILPIVFTNFSGLPRVRRFKDLSMIPKKSLRAYTRGLIIRHFVSCIGLTSIFLFMSASSFSIENLWMASLIGGFVFLLFIIVTIVVFARYIG